MTENAVRIQAILDLYADYAICLEDRRFADWPDFFAETCHYEVRSRENTELDLPGALILCESRGMIEDRITVLTDTLTYRYLHIRHLITNVRIHEVPGGEAGGTTKTSASYLVLHSTEEGETRIFSTGKYEDEIVFEGDDPKFKKKIVTADTFAIDNLLAVPL